MSTLSMGSQQVEQNEKELLEQQRLEALLEITEQHVRNVAQLQSRLETAEKKYDRLLSKSKSDENELKVLRASNPDKLKKQVKRLQEQNRDLTVENSALKVKQKQLTSKLDVCEKELKEEKEKQHDSSNQNAEKGSGKKVVSKNSEAKKSSVKKSDSKKTATKKTSIKKAETKKDDAKKLDSKKSNSKKLDTKKASTKKSLTKESQTKKPVNKVSAKDKTSSKKGDSKKVNKSK